MVCFNLLGAGTSIPADLLALGCRVDSEPLSTRRPRTVGEEDAFAVCALGAAPQLFRGFVLQSGWFLHVCALPGAQQGPGGNGTGGGPE